MQTLNVVNVLDVSLHVPTARRNVIGIKPFQGFQRLKVLVETLLNDLDEQILNRAYGTSFHCPVCGRDCRAKIPTSWLQTRIRGTLSGSMNTNQGLKERAVRESLGFGALRPHGHGLLEGVLDLQFILLPNPDEYQVHVA
ncbi:MAG TPA: hypothetical protein VK845_05510 [Gemmatimonadales bacterium]|nr:hypothetical protein [Gemmatimonadales bacterium]